MQLIKSHIAGNWVEGTGKKVELINPASAAAIAKVHTQGLDVKAAYIWAREQGGPALRDLSYAQRAQTLGQIAKLFKTRREQYLDLSIENSGTTLADSSADVDGAIYTLSYYAKLAAALGEQASKQGCCLLDGAADSLSRDGSFVSQHIMTPLPGAALCINAFNFPAWGLWEKAAAALLSGMPVVARPATATCLLTQVMVEDVLKSGLLPDGALSLICGQSEGLLEHLQHYDVLCFTGSAQTAIKLREHPTVTKTGVRLNIEADSLNSMILHPSIAADSPHAQQFIKDVAREIRIKSGQRCTAPRRIFVHKSIFESLRESLADLLSKVTCGDPRNENVRMGALVNRQQLDTVSADIDLLASQSDLVLDGRRSALIDVDPEKTSCIAPTLLACENPDVDNPVHHCEAFGPVTSLIAYQTEDQLGTMVGLGGGSLVTSIYAESVAEGTNIALKIAAYHGRVQVITPEVVAANTGHGNVMPHSIHGGPGRAGGGEELGGLRALNLYHQRTAIQAGPAAIEALNPS